MYLYVCIICFTHHNLNVEVGPIQKPHVAGQEVPGGCVRGRGAQLTPPPLPTRPGRLAGTARAGPGALGSPPAAPQPQHVVPGGQISLVSSDQTAIR